MTFHVPEKYRVTSDPTGQIPMHRLIADGNNGCFQFVAKTRQLKRSHIAVPGMPGSEVMVPTTHRSILWMLGSDGTGWVEHGYDLPAWEHVSVSVRGEDRVPSWEEMCVVKDMFWDAEDTVIQFHPPKSDYVNYNWKVLHLWRPIGVELPRPPAVMVGPKATV